MVVCCADKEWLHATRMHETGAGTEPVAGTTTMHARARAHVRTHGLARTCPFRTAVDRFGGRTVGSVVSFLGFNTAQHLFVQFYGIGR